MNARAACAIYTRKSSEEGLEQAFNSLDAQRESCLSYIQSQKHEGWTACSDRYDDGGFSGGNMDRPALQKLLVDVQAGKVTTVVVYKVDRLTRSLSDFAKIIEIFDRHKVSFVSVTQQFNTTTSMGRLTLNVLLSFAQFERELTGERIRDKVAAFKKKGMWMGGMIPLGYERVDRKLVVNEPDAETVRGIFREYLRLGSVSKLKAQLDATQVRSKVRVSAAGGKFGGVCYSRGALHHLLTNRVYIGQIVHHGNSYPGQHEPIISQSLWDQVATKLSANDQAHRKPCSCASPSLLKGLVRDINGVRFTPTHSVKNGKRYRYYTSQAAIKGKGDGSFLTRIPGPELDEVVTTQIQRLLGSIEKHLPADEADPIRVELLRKAKLLASEWSKTPDRNDFVRSILRSVILGQRELIIRIKRNALVGSLLGQAPDSCRNSEEPEVITLRTKLQILSRRGKALVFLPEGANSDRKPIESLVRAVARAHDWYGKIISGQVSTTAELARKLGVSSAYVQRNIACATLSPKVVETILAGRQRPHLELAELLDQLSTKWQEQERGLLSALPQRCSGMS
jgi:site-specific DNA recombinase